jgi:hypothetical protein
MAADKEQSAVLKPGPISCMQLAFGKVTPILYSAP